MTFDQHEAELFLAEPHVGVFAVGTSSGPPAAVPLWYAYAPGGDVSMLMAASTRKAKLLKTRREATLVVQTVTPRVRFVSVELELTEVREPTDEDVRAIAEGYLSGPDLEAYLNFAKTNLREDRYQFRTTRWRFGDFTM